MRSPEAIFEGMAPISSPCPLPFYSLFVFTAATLWSLSLPAHPTPPPPPNNCSTVLMVKLVIDTVNAGSVFFHKGAWVALGKPHEIYCSFSTCTVQEALMAFKIPCMSHAWDNLLAIKRNTTVHLCVEEPSGLT